MWKQAWKKTWFFRRVKKLQKLLFLYNSTKNQNRLSYKERRENDLASGDEEGRGKLRKAVISRKQAMSHRYPNGGTRQEKNPVTV